MLGIIEFDLYKSACQQPLFASLFMCCYKEAVDLRGHLEPRRGCLENLCDFVLSFRANTTLFWLGRDREICILHRSLTQENLSLVKSRRVIILWDQHDLSRFSCCTPVAFNTLLIFFLWRTRSYMLLHLLFPQIVFLVLDAFMMHWFLHLLENSSQTCKTVV